MGFFIDEDINRVGRKFLGKPVLCPKMVNKGKVYIPFQMEVVLKIYQNEVTP